MRGICRASSRLVAGFTAALLLSIGLLVGGAAPAAAEVAPISQRSATAVTADALPTTQINGVVWDQVIVGDTVYAGGQFTSARPAGSPVGTNETPRNNLLAYNIRTGNLITTFAPNVNGQVKALAVSQDRTRLYIAGTFTQVNGVNRYRVAAFDLATGALVSNFAPAPNTTVNSIAVTPTAVYIGGAFTKVGAVDRLRLAAFSPANGALLNWGPAADATVQSVLPTPDRSRILIAGSFANLNGTTALGLGAIDSTTAATLPWTANTVVQNYGSSAAMLKLRTDGTTVYAVGYWFGGAGNFEGVLAADPNSGDVKWLADCHGDTYDVTPMNDVVYSVSHWHHCTNIGGYPDTNPRNAWYYANALTKETRGTVAHNDQCCYYDFYGYGAPAMVNWFPTLQAGTFTGKSQAAWSAAATNEYLVLGGEFPSVNGVPQYGLVRFAIPSLAPKKQGPRVAGAPFNPSVLAVRNDAARIAWRANHDRDDQVLTYSVYRSGTAAPIHTTDATSQFWNRPTLSFTDTGLTPGGTYRYRVTARDPDGNTVTSDNVSVTLPQQVDPYVSAVIEDGASNYWRLNNSSSPYTDVVGGLHQNAGAGVSPTSAGALSMADGSLDFNGTEAGQTGAASAIPGPNTFSVEAWIKTTTTSGGKIVGFGDTASGSSSNYDRHLYMENGGRITYGIHPGHVEIVRSTKAYNDGQWHHLVGTTSPSGSTLYIDGVRVGTNGGGIGAQPFTGFWRLGGDNLNGWPDQPRSAYFAGTIDEVAVYPTALSGTQARDHYVKSGRSLTPPPAPTDAYGKAVYADDPSLYWRLNEAGGTTAADVTPNTSDGTYSGGVAYQAPSAVAEPPYGVNFNGTDAGVGSNDSFGNPSNYSTEVWFKTTTGNGGKLIGFGDQRTGLSGNYDRHVYMEHSGQLTFGVWTGDANVIHSPKAYNDGKWHHVLASQSTSSGMKLYVDGELVGTHPQTGAQPYSGYWRIGGDSPWAASAYFAGTLDEAAVYTSVLSAERVKAHYEASPVAANAAPTAAFSYECTERSCAFDGAPSSDSDGTIVAYAWDFGDGATSDQAKPSHTYATNGTYNVKLTVTDDRGKTSSVTKAVAARQNSAPVADFSAECQALTCSVDASSSTDPDGDALSYAWEFGDGGSGTGRTASHTYASAGDYTITLTVTDPDGATSRKTTAATVSSAPNQAPTAAFTISGSGLAKSFDATGSSDSDGTIESYAWNFGDGTTGTGQTPSRTYSGTGIYTVTLTVTDDDGEQDSVSKQVVVGGNVLAADVFNRNVTRWGTADQGGTYTYSGSTFATDGESGTIRIASAGASATASLSGVSARDVDVVADVALDSIATGGGTYTSFLVRKVGTSDYRLALRHLTGGKLALSLTKTVNGTSTSLRSVSLTEPTYQPGDKIRVRLTVTGNGTTTLAARAWRVGTAEPASSQVTATDTTTSLQTAGSFSLIGYLSASATVAPVTFSIDNLLLTGT